MLTSCSGATAVSEEVFFEKVNEIEEHTYTYAVGTVTYKEYYSDVSTGAEPISSNFNGEEQFAYVDGYWMPYASNPFNHAFYYVGMNIKDGVKGIPEYYTITYYINPFTVIAKYKNEKDGHKSEANASFEYDNYGYLTSYRMYYLFKDSGTKMEIKENINISYQ